MIRLSRNIYLNGRSKRLGRFNRGLDIPPPPIPVELIKPRRYQAGLVGSPISPAFFFDSHLNPSPNNLKTLTKTKELKFWDFFRGHVN